MAASKTLPIYREATSLIIHLYQCTKKAPRELRFTLVQRLLDESVEVCVDIANANRTSGPERSARIAELAARITRVEVLLVIAMEQRCLSQPAAAMAMQHIDGLGRQCAGWAAHTKKTPVMAAGQN